MEKAQKTKSSDKNVLRTFLGRGFHDVIKSNGAAYRPKQFCFNILVTKLIKAKIGPYSYHKIVPKSISRIFYEVYHYSEDNVNE